MNSSFIESPINYTGSKINILDQILPKFDYTKSIFVDAFVGGGSVFSNVLDKYERVIINDKIQCLSNIHKSIIEEEDFYDRVKSLSSSVTDIDSFNRLRDGYNNDKSPDKLFALITCSTNNMLRFNKNYKYNQTFGKRNWNTRTSKKSVIYKDHLMKYKSKLNFSSCCFSDLVVDSDKFMVYCDPPYGRIMNEYGEILNKQITEAGYNCFWNLEDDEKLYNFLKNIDKLGSSFAISGILNKGNEKCWILHKLIQDGYKKMNIVNNYNKVSRVGKKDIEEVLVLNYS